LYFWPKQEIKNRGWGDGVSKIKKAEQEKTKEKSGPLQKKGYPGRTTGGETTNTFFLLQKTSEESGALGGGGGDLGRGQKKKPEAEGTEATQNLLNLVFCSVKKWLCGRTVKSR